MPQIVPASVGVATRKTASHFGLGQLLHLAGDVLVAVLEPLRVHDLEAELLGREVDAGLARLAVGVVLDHRADVLALAAALVDVVVERVDRLDLVRPADRQQVLLTHPQRVERRRRGDHLVALELRQHRQRRRRAEQLHERHDVALDLVVLLHRDVREVLRVLLDELDLVLARRSPPSALTASKNTSLPAVSGLPMTATGPVSGVSTPSLIVLPSKPGTSVTSPPPPPPSSSSSPPPHAATPSDSASCGQAPQSI